MLFCFRKRAKSDSPNKQNKQKRVSMDKAVNQTRKNSKSVSKSRERGDSTTNKGKLTRKSMENEESGERTIIANNGRSKSKSQERDGSKSKSQERDGSKSKSQERDGSKSKRKSLPEKDNKSSKSRERPIINYNENDDSPNDKKSAKNTSVTESNETEDFHFDPVYQKYSCLYCPNSFHPLKARAKAHSKTKKHQQAKENAVADPSNKAVNDVVTSPKESKKKIPKNYDSDNESSPKEKAANKRGRPQKINQTEVNDTQDAPASKRNRRKPKQYENTIDPEDLSEHINIDESEAENLPTTTKKSTEEINPPIENKSTEKTNNLKDKVVEVSHKMNKPNKKRSRPTSKKVIDKENVNEMSEDLEQTEIVVQKKRQKIRVENPLKKRALENITQDQNVSVTFSFFLLN